MSTHTHTLTHTHHVILIHAFNTSYISNRGNLAYEANYCAGLRILDVSNIQDPDSVKEVGYFDVAPYCNSPKFQGSWSNYPYFKSGTIIVSSIERGLFVLKYTGGN